MAAAQALCGASVFLACAERSEGVERCRFVAGAIMHVAGYAGETAHAGAAQPSHPLFTSPRRRQAYSGAVPRQTAHAPAFDGLAVVMVVPVAFKAFQHIHGKVIARLGGHARGVL